MKVGNAQERARLRELGNKIRSLVKEYDVAALVNIQGRDQAEFIVELEPSWSCMRVLTVRGGSAIRFSSKMSSGGPEEKERARLTVGIVLGLIAVAESQVAVLTQLRAVLAKHMDIEHVSINQENTLN